MRKTTATAYSTTRLTADQEQALARRLRGQPVRVPPPGDPYPSPEAARRRLIEQNVGLAAWVARRWASATEPLEDLIQEGVIGLHSAVERFDPDAGCRFSTYALWWIRRSIRLALVDRTGGAREPHGVPTRLEALDSETDEAVGPWYTVSRPVSLDASDGEGEHSLLDRIPADLPSPEEQALASSHRAAVRGLLLELPPRERRVVELRYGVGCRPGATLQEIGRLVGVSAPQVRQIESRALNRLRHSRAARQLLLTG